MHSERNIQRVTDVQEREIQREHRYAYKDGENTRTERHTGFKASIVVYGYDMSPDLICTRSQIGKLVLVV
jgi:hypothetical protein